MKKQQYINKLEAVVLRSPDKTQECSLQVKQSTPPQFLFKDFAYILQE